MSETNESKNVELIILREGSMHGKAGTRIFVDEKTAESLCQVRKTMRAGKEPTMYRIAKRANEVVTPVQAGTLTIGEARALGMKNVVKTPPDDILPKGLKPEEKEATYVEAAVLAEAAFGQAEHQPEENEDGIETSKRRASGKRSQPRSVGSNEAS